MLLHVQGLVVACMWELTFVQYMGSASLVRVDWKRVGARFEDAFHSKDASGQSKPPTVLSLWNWIINFLTADFQPRASFVAGFVLGLRIG
jgi:FUN14 domain-containing protein 1